MGSLSQFMKQFHFDPSKAGFVGVEREFFLSNEKGEIVPFAYNVLNGIQSSGWCPPSYAEHEHFNLDALVGYELSACQVETRTRPRTLAQIYDELSWQQEQLFASVSKHGLCLNYNEVAPVTMPLDVYPDPTGRYAKISKNMPHDVLLAACRVIGTHIHVGMGNHEEALRVYNRVIKETSVLCKLGDHSHGERLKIYKVVAPNAEPMPYDNWDHFFHVGQEAGFVEDPRKCWTLIRISSHGTIEFRMFGTTQSVAEVVSWVQTCHELCFR